MNHRPKLQQRPGLDSRLVTHTHRLGSVRCTGPCGRSQILEFECQVPVLKRECPEPERKRREFVCFSCEQRKKDENLAQLRASLIENADLGNGLYDAAHVFQNMRKMLADQDA